MADKMVIDAEVVDKFSDPIKRLRSQMQSLGRETKEHGRTIGDGFAHADRALSKTAATVTNSLTPALGSIGVTSLGVTAALAGIGAAVRNFTTNAAGLGQLGRDTGIAAQQLRDVQSILGKVGVDAGASGSAIQGLAEKFRIARTGGGELMEFLRKQGTSTEGRKYFNDLADSIMRSKDNGEALTLALKGMEGISDPAGRRTYAQNVLGLADAARLAEKHRGTITEQLNKAGKEAGPLTPEMVKSAEDYDKALSGLATTMKKIGTAISMELEGPLARVAVAIKGFMDGERSGVQPAIVGVIRDAVAYIEGIDWAGAFKKLGDGFGEVKTELGKAFEEVRNLLRQLGNGDASAAVGAVFGEIGKAATATATAIRSVALALSALNDAKNFDFSAAGKKLSEIDRLTDAGAGKRSNAEPSQKPSALDEQLDAQMRGQSQAGAVEAQRQAENLRASRERAAAIEARREAAQRQLNNFDAMPKGPGSEAAQRRAAELQAEIARLDEEKRRLAATAPASPTAPLPGQEEAALRERMAATQRQLDALGQSKRPADEMATKRGEELRREMSRLTDELKRLRDAMPEKKPGEATAQQSSLDGGGAFGGARVQTASFGGGGAYGGGSGVGGTGRGLDAHGDPHVRQRFEAFLRNRGYSGNVPNAMGRVGRGLQGLGEQRRERVEQQEQAERRGYGSAPQGVPRLGPGGVPSLSERNFGGGRFNPLTGVPAVRPVPGGAADRVGRWQRGEADPEARGRQVEGANPGDYKDVLDHIAKAEGTAGRSGGGYNTSLDYGKWLPGGKEGVLTGKTLDEIDELQTGMLANPDNRRKYGNGLGSSAIGRYQIVRKTLRGLRRKLGLKGDDLYDEKMQDRLAAELARARGADPVGLGQEWASLHGERGRRAAELMARVPRSSSTTPRDRPSQEQADGAGFAARERARKDLDTGAGSQSFAEKIREMQATADRKRMDFGGDGGKSLMDKAMRSPVMAPKVNANAQFDVTVNKAGPQTTVSTSASGNLFRDIKMKRGRTMQAGDEES